MFRNVSSRIIKAICFASKHSSVKVAYNFARQMTVDEWKLQKVYQSGIVVKFYINKDNLSSSKEELDAGHSLIAISK